MKMSKKHDTQQHCHPMDPALGESSPHAVTWSLWHSWLHFGVVLHVQNAYSHIHNQWLSVIPKQLCSSIASEYPSSQLQSYDPMVLLQFCSQVEFTHSLISRKIQYKWLTMSAFCTHIHTLTIYSYCMHTQQHLMYIKILHTRHVMYLLPSEQSSPIQPAGQTQV